MDTGTAGVKWDRACVSARGWGQCDSAPVEVFGSEGGGVGSRSQGREECEGQTVEVFKPS